MDGRWAVLLATGTLNKRTASVEMVFVLQKDGFVLTKPVFRFLSYSGFFDLFPIHVTLGPKISVHRSQEFANKCCFSLDLSHGWEFRKIMAISLS